MSIIYTFIHIILWMESAREIHRNYIFRNSYSIMGLLFFTFIILIEFFIWVFVTLFPILKFQKKLMIPIGWR